MKKKKQKSYVKCETPTGFKYITLQFTISN